MNTKPEHIAKAVTQATEAASEEMAKALTVILDSGAKQIQTSEALQDVLGPDDIHTVLVASLGEALVSAVSDCCAEYDVNLIFVVEKLIGRVREVHRRGSVH